MTDIQLPLEFLEDFIRTAEKAKKRIFLQSMLFESGKILSKLEPILIKKAREGIDVRINRDWVSQRYVHSDVNLIPTLNSSKREYAKKLHEKNAQIMQRWSKEGIIITETNTPLFFSRLISISGRNHIKMYLIDDTAAWLGGINLGDKAFEWIDFVAKFTDKDIIEALAWQFFRVNKNKPENNYAVGIASGNTLLIDAGIRGKSIIYNEATQIVAEAKKTITFASQFVPDGKLLDQLILAARRDVNVTVYTAHKRYRNFTTFPLDIPFRLFKTRTEGINNISLHHQRTNVHAKLLLADGKTALFGSHNLVQIGVFLKTEEIAVRTRDKHIIRQLYDFIKNNTIKA